MSGSEFNDIVRAYYSSGKKIKGVGKPLTTEEVKSKLVDRVKKMSDKQFKQEYDHNVYLLGHKLRDSYTGAQRKQIAMKTYTMMANSHGGEEVANKLYTKFLK